MCFNKLKVHIPFKKFWFSDVSSTCTPLHIGAVSRSVSSAVKEKHGSRNRDRFQVHRAVATLALDLEDGNHVSGAWEWHFRVSGGALWQHGGFFGVLDRAGVRDLCAESNDGAPCDLSRCAGRATCDFSVALAGGETYKVKREVQVAHTSGLTLGC